MFLPSNIHSNSDGPPLKYTQSARESIKKTLASNSKFNSSATILKYGSSPLSNHSINASSLSVSSTSNISSDHEEQPAQKKKKIFSGLLSRSSTNSSKRSLVSSSSMNNNRSSNNLEQQLTDTSSVISDISLLTTNTEQESFISNSVFSNDLSSISTANTSVNQESIIGSGSNNGNGNGKQLVITLEEALPSNFQDMYSPDTLIDVLPNGRPKFTKRDIIDWELNDIRALLIVDSLEPNWNNQIPVISSRENIFKIQYLPLDSSDNRIIQTLVESDIYRETNFHINFRVKSATYIVKTARQRHVRMLKDLYHIQDDLRDTELANTPFLRYELRNIVENFLLNLGVESQCRSDFKKNCSVVKKQKRQLYGLDNMMFIDDDGTVSNRSDAKTLLKKAIINSANNCGSVNVNRNNMTFKLSQEEKAKLWYDVQLNIYRRLELDWQPDNIR